MKKYILVTGGEGYIGSNLIKSLLTNNFNVISMDLKKSKKFHPNLNSFKVDIKNFDKIYNILIKYNISYIYHLGAYSDINYSVHNPKKTLINNILSTYNLLKIAHLKKIKKFIFASSIYTNSTQGSYYRISKLTSEELIEEHNRLYRLNFIIVRYGSLFGDFNFNNTINSLIKSALDNKLVYRQGSGHEMRNYILIDDAIKLTLKLLKKSYKKKYYNILGYEKLNFRSIAKIIKKEIPNLKIKYSNIADPHHYINNPYNKKNKVFYNLTIIKNNYIKNSLKEYIQKLKNK